MKLGLAVLFTFLGLVPSARAAYRVYKLKVEVYNAKGKLERKQFVVTSLDHLQYEHYNAGYRWHKVTFVDTWFCPGDTRNFRPYCLPPKVGDRAPASTPEGNNRITLPYSRQPVIP